MLTAGIVFAIASAAVLVGWMAAKAYVQRRPSDDLRVIRCDQCDQPATVHLIDTFDDGDEREFAGGRTAMRADYCHAHAEELGVA